MRALVTGAGGMVGGAVASSLLGRGHEVEGVVRTRPGPEGVRSRQLCLDVPGAFEDVVATMRPDVVIHAAYSMAHPGRDIDIATELVATACRRHDVAVVHVSTDAVFDGEHAPYAETDVPAPIHDYGRSKGRAEQMAAKAIPDVAIVRLSLVVHLDADRPDPASRWLVDATRRGHAVTLFTDEVRTVVQLDDAVWGLVRVAELDRDERAGPWHLGGPRALTRAELGRTVIDRFGLDDSTVQLGSSSEVAGPRPRDVSLSCARAVERLGWAPRAVDTVTGHGQA